MQYNLTMKTYVHVYNKSVNNKEFTTLILDSVMKVYRSVLFQIFSEGPQVFHT